VTEQDIQDLANRLIAAIEHLAPGGPAWWTIVGSLAPLAALLAAWLVYNSARKTLKQREKADDRAEWWRRTQWALEATISEDDTMSGYGTGMLKLLADSELASADDRALLDNVWKDSDAATEQDAEELIQDAADLREEETLENFSETGNNEVTKEDTDGENLTAQGLR
jgi:hypothetical protein